MTSVALCFIRSKEAVWQQDKLGKTFSSGKQML